MVLMAVNILISHCELSLLMTEV